MDISQKISTKNPECWYVDTCKKDKQPCNTCPQYIEMSYLMTHCNLPKAKQKIIRLTAPECDKAAYARLREIGDNMEDFVYAGKNLYLGSASTGSGKTSWAIKLMHNYFNQIWNGNGLRERALFISVPMFLMECKNFESDNEDFIALREQLKTIDLVIWDDVASTDISPYDYLMLLAYIDHRRLSELANIFTSNYANRDDLLNAVGDRLTSRIWSLNSTEVIIFKSGDIR